MDRKHCILLYSNYSQASIELLTYIKGLPLDFPKITGMTIICVDHEQFRDTLQKNGIEYVPTLLVEYYKGATPNQTKQKFERDYIYMWIDQVMKALRFEWPQTPRGPDQQPVGQELQEQRGSRRRTEFPAVTANGPPHQQHDGNVNQTGGVMDRADLSAPPPQEDVPQIQKKEKLDITALAQQMAKDRDLYISDTAPAHKKGRGPQ
jgi:hypothetical protein